MGIQGGEIMSFACVTGGKLCDGCMRCYEEAHDELRCPVCKELLNPGEDVFIDRDGFVLGCEYCLKRKCAESIQECWEN